MLDIAWKPKERGIDLNRLLFKYLVYNPVLILRREWIYGHLRNLKKSQYWDRKKLERYQVERMNSLLAHARATVPYYKDIKVEKIDSINDLSLIELLDKDIVRSEYNELISTKAGFLSRNKTSGGSTGAPVTIRKDSLGMAKELAATWRGYQWAGIDVGDRQARFWGVPTQRRDYNRARLIDFVGNRKRLSAFSFSDKEFQKYVEMLKRFKPAYFYGYVSLIKQFAEYVEGNQLQNFFSLKAVITTSEVLTKIDREVISRAFSTRVYNEYGCGEVGTIAHECEYGRMHINSENMIVEVIGKDGSPVPAGESGELVVTDLCNYSMPLIRYRMKDFGRVSHEVCRCGRGLHILEEVQGREYDVLLNSAGQSFHGEFFLYMVEDLKKGGTKVDGVQFIQNQDKSLLINVVCNPEEFSVFSEFIGREIYNRFDQTVNVKFCRVSQIDREPSGKLRVVKRVS